MDGFLGLSWWQWFFFIEGLVTIGVGIAAFVLLPGWNFVEISDGIESPEECKWLSESERAIIIRKCPKDKRVNTLHSVEALKVHFRDTILSPHNLLLAAVLWFVIFSEIGVLFFLPKIITDMGVKGFIGNLLTIFPYSFTMASMILWARRSDRKEVIYQQQPIQTGYNRYWYSK